VDVVAAVDVAHHIDDVSQLQEIRLCNTRERKLKPKLL
jgi:hypothetical protein